MALLTNDEKWEAVVHCDKASDNLFFYAVKTTGVFCRPSCKAKTPMRKNVTFFVSAEAARLGGFRPCKRCRPDIATYEPELEMVRKVEEELRQTNKTPSDFNHVAKQLGISPNHLGRLFKQNTGLTPTQYSVCMRITKARSLLRQSKVGILEIAHDAGFLSISNFYKSFKEQTGLTPSEYRKAGDGEA